MNDHWIDAIRYGFLVQKEIEERLKLYKALPWYKKIFTKFLWNNLFN